MRFSRIALENWRNFGQVDVPLQTRAFLVGPNASGKSNFLDAFRFLRDLVVPGGGFEQAVISRGGFLRLLNMTTQIPPFPDVVIDIQTLLDDVHWRYRLAFNEGENHHPILTQEQVWRDDNRILDRPNENDQLDPSQRQQTYLEQAFTRRQFHELADFLASITYFHLVPQFVREPARIRQIVNDPYGSDLVQRIAQLDTKTQQARIQRVVAALKLAVPQLADLKLERDKSGVTRLRGKFRNIESNGITYSAWYDESDFSDGTLRLIGLLWSLLESKGPLLLEEPELSLHSAIVHRIPQMLWRAKRDQQVLISTHSPELLRDEGIGMDEVLVFQLSEKGSAVRTGADIEAVRRLFEIGLPAAEAVFSFTRPADTAQLTLWGD